MTEHVPNLQGVYLFGSYANTTETMESDVDIAVLASDKVPANVLQEVSYQLAKIFKEKQIIFVNKISSSKTTGRQKNLIMSIGYNFKIYYIIDFEDHQKNVEEMKKECTKWNKKVLKAKIYTHIAFEELKISIKKLNQYIENFHLQYGKFSLSDFCTEKTYIKLITQKLLEKI